MMHKYVAQNIRKILFILVAFFVFSVIFSYLLETGIIYFSLYLLFISSFLVILYDIKQNNNLKIPPPHVMTFLAGLMSPFLAIYTSKREYFLSLGILIVTSLILFAIHQYFNFSISRYLKPKFDEDSEYLYTSRHKDGYSNRVIVAILFFSSIFLVVQYLIISFSSCEIALINYNSDKTISLKLDDPILVSPGSEKMINISAVSDRLYPLIICPMIRIKHDDNLPQVASIKVLKDKMRPNNDNSIQILLNINDSAMEGNYTISILPYWSMFRYFERNMSNETINLRVLSVINLSSDKQDPQIAGTPILWTADLLDTYDKDEFIFMFQRNDSVTRDWSINNTWLWSPAQSEVGLNIIKVTIYNVRNIRQNLSKSIIFNITENKPPIVKLEKPLPTNFFNASSIDPENNNLKYRFMIKCKDNDGAAWQLVQDWSDIHQWSQNISLNSNDYWLLVSVKDEFHDPMKKNWSGCNDTITFHVGEGGNTVQTPIQNPTESATSRPTLDEPTAEDKPALDQLSSTNPLEPISSTPTQNQQVPPSESTEPKNEMPTSKDTANTIEGCINGLFYY